MTKEKRPILISVLALASMMMVAAAISPILAELAIAFPDAGNTRIQYVYTISQLASIAAILAVGRLAVRIDNRKLAFAGILMIIAGGLIPVFIHGSLAIMYTSSLLIGMGAGTSNILSATLIAEHFAGNAKGTMMGYQSAFLSIGAMVMSIISGFIASRMQWNYAYLTYMLAILILIIVWKFLPAGVSGTGEEQDIGTPEHFERTGMTGAAWYFAIMSFFSSVLMNTFLSDIALFLSDTGLGNSAVAGTVNSIFLLLGIPAGALLGRVIKVLGRKLMWLMSLIMAAALMMVAVSGSLPLVYIGAVIFGIGYAIRNPSAITFISYMVDPETAPTAISLNQGLSSLGMFCTPLIINAISPFFGGGGRAAFMVGAVGMLIITVLYILFNPITPEQAGKLAETAE